MGLALVLVVSVLATASAADEPDDLLDQVVRHRAVLLDPRSTVQGRSDALEALIAVSEDVLEPSRDRQVARGVAVLTIGSFEDDDDAAITRLLEAQQIARVIDEPGLLLTAASEVARRYRQLGALEQAHAHLADVIATFDDDAASAPVRVGLPNLQVDLAELLVSMGRHRDALRHLDHAMAELDEGIDFHRSLRCRILGLQGQAYLHLGLPDVAAGPLAAQMDCAALLLDQEVAGAELAHQEAVIRSIHLYLATEQFERVVDLARAALDGESYQYVPDQTRHQLHLRLGMAYAELAKDDPKLAGLAIESARRGLSGLPPLERIPGRLLLAELAVRGGRAEDARQWLHEVSTWFDEHPASERESGLRVRWRVQSAVLRSRLLRLDPQGPEEVARVHAELDRAYGDLLDEWERSSWRTEGTAFLHFGVKSAAVGEVLRMEVSRHPGRVGAERALSQLLRAQRLATVTRSRGTVDPDLHEIRRVVLRPGELVLCYLVTPDATHVCALSESDVEHVEHPFSRTDIEPIISEFRELCVRSPRREPTDAARARRRARIDELGDELKLVLMPGRIAELVDAASHVTIVSSDLLSHLPFESLPWADGSRLGRSKALSYLPSLPLGVILARDADAPREAEGTGPEIGWIGAPRHDSSAATDERYPKLRLTLGDVERATAAYGGSVLVSLGSGATRVRLADLSRSVAKVLQVWTHGIHEPLREPPAGLLLAPLDDGDGRVRYQDILEMEAPPLVVLAACGAANGPTRRGEDLVARLDAAFLRAGARVVVLPSADAAERTTLRLVETFHDRLRRHGDEPSEAMRRARVELASDPRYDDPFYDGNMHVVGLGHVPLFEERRRDTGLSLVTLLLAAGAIAVIAATAIVVRRRTT